MSLLRRASKSSVDSWQFAAVGVGVVAILSIVVRTAQRLGDVARVDAEVEAALAHAVAEDHALEYALHVGCSEERSSGEFRSLMTVDSELGRRTLRIEVQAEAGARYEFACDLLEGALPDALCRPLTLFGDARQDLLRELPAVLRTRARSRHAELPRVDLSDHDVERIDASRRRAFRRDDTIALMRLPHGTDRADYVLIPDEDGVIRPGFGASRTLVLDGNLWIRGDGAFATLEVDGPCLLVVTGNVYFTCSTVVRDGELVVMTRRASGGSWGEGSGGAFVGLPGENGLPPRSLSLELSLVTADRCVIGCEIARVAGALAVGGALESPLDDVRLRLPGSRLPDPRRRLNGVELRGGARPGRLELVDSRPSI